MRFDPAEMVAGIEAALEDERGFSPDMPEPVIRLAEIVCSVMNQDGVYDRRDLEQHIRDTTPNYFNNRLADYFPPRKATQ